MTIKEHIDKLTKDLPIPIKWLDSTKGEHYESGIDIDYFGGHPEPWRANFPIPIDDFTYGIALHELGHLYGADKPMDARGFRHTSSETIAWKWAKENAIHWTRPMYDAAEEGLTNHRNVHPIDILLTLSWLWQGVEK